MPCPYARLIVGTRHCRALIVGNINSDATGFDITGSRACLESHIARLCLASARKIEAKPLDLRYQAEPGNKCRTSVEEGKLY